METKKVCSKAWGDKLARPNSYDPKSDFFNTGTNFINSLTLSTGTKQNQTFASVSSTNSKGIVPNNSYDRLNFTIRNTATFLDDKLQLDLGASYVKQEDKNMVSQGQYWNPVISAYLFPVEKTSKISRLSSVMTRAAIFRYSIGRLPMQPTVRRIPTGLLTATSQRTRRAVICLMSV